jgi:hypothetical protein
VTARVKSESLCLVITTGRDIVSLKGERVIPVVHMTEGCADSLHSLLETVMTLPIEFREKIYGFLVMSRPPKDERPSVDARFSIVALAPLPRTRESRREATKACVESQIDYQVFAKYKLYDPFTMHEYHQFVYLILALERFELERIEFMGWKKWERSEALKRAEVGILQDVLTWFRKNTILDLHPFYGGARVSLSFDMKM